MATRFTVDGSDALEAQIAADMAKIRLAVLDVVGPENLTALILGGGYGRGEGGVYVIDGEERVYNDYDFFVVVPFAARRRRNWVTRQLLQVKARMEPACGIHVDFSAPMPYSQLPDYPYELMFMEVKAGYHVVYGPENVLDALPAYDTQRPPLEEGARLFMNRGVGLLLAQRLLRTGTPLNKEEHEFVVRNIYKALLALGDNVLCLQGNYSPSYVERYERLQQIPPTKLPEGQVLLEQYAQAHQFKLRPDHTPPDDISLPQWHEETVGLFNTVFLWYEQHRLNQPYMTWEDYAKLKTRLPELSARERFKNQIRNMRSRQGGLPPVQELGLHPRDRILKRLPALLLSNAAAPEEEALALHLWEQYG